jgi:hypothetical protein
MYSVLEPLVTKFLLRGEHQKADLNTWSVANNNMKNLMSCKKNSKEKHRKKNIFSRQIILKRVNNTVSHISYNALLPQNLSRNPVGFRYMENAGRYFGFVSM